MAGPDDTGSGDEGQGTPPADSRDVFDQIVGSDLPNPPPLPPDDVVPIAGDSAGPPSPTPDAGDVVPIAGDSSAPPPLPSGPLDLPSLQRPNPFFDDDDDDDDDDQPWLTPWKIVAIALVAVAALALSFFIFTSNGTKAPISQAAATQPATAPTATVTVTHPTCPPPTVVGALTMIVNGKQAPEACVGPAQYKSDPRNKYYSYFAWETMLDNRQVQIVVTGDHLTMPVTSKVTSNIAAVATSGTKLADVDVYDNASGAKFFATTGSVRLDPSGAVRFEHVKLKFRNDPVSLTGLLLPD